MLRQKPVVGLLPCDPAGIGPELIANILKRGCANYIPLVIAPAQTLRYALERYAPALSDKIVAVDAETPKLDTQDPACVYLMDIPASESIEMGRVSAASGHIMIDSLCAAIDLKKKSIIDGFFFGPLTKQSIHEADPSIQSEFELFDREFGINNSSAIGRHGRFVRASVTGHCALREVLDLLTVENICQTGLDLYHLMKMFGMENEGMAVAALNPHASDGGIFGHEEAEIIEPAVKMLAQRCNTKVIGPCPADTVFLRAHSGEVSVRATKRSHRIKHVICACPDLLCTLPWYS